MSLPAALADAEIAIRDDYGTIGYAVAAPGQMMYGEGGGPVPFPERPSVSCLMVTRGDVGRLRFAVDCYARQSWPARELVIVTDADRAAAVEDFVRSQAIHHCSVTGAPPGLNLGDLRNMALARARGHVLMQWDDDDLYDPHRIRTAVMVLKATGAGAAFLERWLIWWPERGVAALSGRRPWEGSIAVRRECARPYPAKNRGEDTYPSNAILMSHPTAIVRAPLLYVYTVTGQNTWKTAHFESLLNVAEAVFEGAEYEAVLNALDHRMPIRAYAASLTGG